MTKYETNDNRTQEQRDATTCFVVATDSFMSGWGKAPGRSLFAVPCENYEQAEIVADNMRARSEMKRVRIVGDDWRPRLGRGDHLSIANPASCKRFFTPNGWRMTFEQWAELAGKGGAA